MASVAASIGGVLSVSAILGVLIMMSSIKKYSVWCGAALLRSRVAESPPIRESALKPSDSLPNCNAGGGSIPPLRTSVHLRPLWGSIRQMQYANLHR